MSSSKIELIRGYMEEIENTKKAIVLILHEKASNVEFWLIKPKNTVIQDHKVKALLEAVQSRAMDVYLLLQDKNG